MSNNLRLHIPIIPPSPIGTFKGVHLYLEAPDQSSAPVAKADGVTLMDGSYVLGDNWSPIDLGLFPYVATEQPFTLEVYIGLDVQVATNVRVYASSYSADIDLPLVRYGTSGATPSTVITVAAKVSGKPNSGSNITAWLVTGISGAVGSAISVGGKLRRPVGITVDLSGLSAHLPTNWAYQLLGFVNGNITSNAILASGYLTQDGLIPAGPDGITAVHTFAPEEPTAITSITVYAVAGLITGDNYMPRRNGNLPPGTFVPNNIVPGITASCVISIGTTTGVTDPTEFVQVNLNGVFGNVSGLFDITPLAIDNARQGPSSVAAINLQALAVTNPKLASLAVQAANLATASVSTAALQALAVDAAALAGSSVISTKIANLAVGTAAIANAAVGTAAIANLAVTNALIANLSVGTAQIQNLAVDDSKIQSLSVGKLLAGTITVAISLTSPTIVVTAGATTINLDATNFLKLSKSGFTQQIGTGLSGGFGTVDGILVTGSSGSQVTIESLGIHVGSTSGAGSFYASITTGAFFIANPGSGSAQLDYSGLTINSVHSIKARYGTTPVVLADVIALLQYHGLCV